MIEECVYDACSFTVKGEIFLTLIPIGFVCGLLCGFALWWRNRG